MIDLTNLQVSLIDGVQDVLCDCGCKDCGKSECSEYCNLLMVRAKIDVYKRIINPQAVAFFDAVYSETINLVEKPTQCAVTEEIIRGESSCNIKLIKQLIALDYLALYFYELTGLEDEVQIQIIKDKFKSEKILCCIEDLCIDVENIQNLINNNMGLFTINSGEYVNLPPSQVGDNTISAANRATTTLTTAMFTTQTTPVYQDPENDPVSGIRIDTLPADGILRLSGTPIVAGQIIPIVDVDNGNLTYDSPDQDALDTDSFNFSLRDSGSNLFSS